MNRMIRSLLLAAGLAVAAISAADAAQIRMCSPFAGAQATQGRWVAAGSGTAYTKNVRGCMLISPADLGDAQAGGYFADPPVVVAYQLGAAGTVTLPAGAYIDSITIQETAGQIVTGGLDIGTAAAGQQVIAALAVGASGLVTAADTVILKRAFSSTSPQTLYITAHTNWTDAAIVNVTIHYSYF